MLIWPGTCHNKSGLINISEKSLFIQGREENCIFFWFCYQKKILNDIVKVATKMAIDAKCNKQYSFFKK
jgi:hypothetical protein